MSVGNLTIKLEMEDRGEVGVLARFRQFGVSMAVAGDCDTQALSGFLDSVAALKDCIERTSSKKDFNESILEEGHLKLAMAKDLWILLLNKKQVDFLQVTVNITGNCNLCSRACYIGQSNYERAQAVEMALRLIMWAPTPSSSFDEAELMQCTLGLLKLLVSVGSMGSTPTVWSHACVAAKITRLANEEMYKGLSLQHFQI